MGRGRVLWAARFALLLGTPLLLFALLELTGWAMGVEPIAETRAFQARESSEAVA
jgi:hypothetical protein